ncbi:RHS repeat protein, partial [Parvularcula oceani]|uniref:RHS repeat protein n=1 Tax=Parvularcula oceani TaxID=1247963 RepID=UPI00138E3C3D
MPATRRSKPSLSCAGATLAALLASAALAAGVSGSAAAQELPGFERLEGAPVTPSAAYSRLGSSTTHTDGQTAAEQADVHVSTLADNIWRSADTPEAFIRDAHAYVLNNVGTEFRFGLAKGANATLLDQSGTAFDQANLLQKLLIEKGIDAKIAIGMLSVSVANAAYWAGLEVAPASGNTSLQIREDVLCRAFADGGIPIAMQGGAALDCNRTQLLSGTSQIQVGHAWVETGGGSASWDPSLTIADRSQSFNPCMEQGVQCASAAKAALGSPYSSTEYRNVSFADVDTALNGKSMELIDILKGQPDWGSAAETFGRRSDPAAFAAWAEPGSGPGGIYTKASGFSAAVGDIPDQFRVKIHMNFAGVLPATLFLDEVYGQRLRIVTASEIDYRASNPSQLPSLYVGTKKIADGTAVNYSIAGNRYLHYAVDFPYAAGGGAYGDLVQTFHPRVWVQRYNGGEQDWERGSDGLPLRFPTVISLIAQPGRGGTGLETYLQQQLSSESDHQIGCSTATCRNRMLLWEGRDSTLAAQKLHSETGSLLRLQEGVANVSIRQHGQFGFIEDIRGEQRGTPVTLISRTSLIDHEGDAAKEAANFETLSLLASALEGGAIRRHYAAPDAVSAVSLFRVATAKGQSLVRLRTSSDLGQLGSGYTSLHRQYLSDLLSAGYDVIVPRSGEVGRSVDGFDYQFHYIPAYVYEPGARVSSLVYMNAGLTSDNTFAVRKGGGAGVPSGVDPAKAALEAHELQQDPEAFDFRAEIDPASGALNLPIGAPLVTGSGEFPMSLAYGLSYDLGPTRSTLDFDKSKTVETGTVETGFTSTTTNTTTKLAGVKQSVELSATITSDTQRGLGSGDAIGAARLALAIRMLNDLNTGSPDFADRVLSMAIAAWFDGALYENAVNVTGGPAPGSYLKLPDGSFEPPVGTLARLTQTGVPKLPLQPQQYSFDYTDISFRLESKGGDIIDFTNVSKSYPISERRFFGDRWKFRSGVEVYYTWDNGGLLRHMANSIGRSITVSVSEDGAFINVADDSGRTVAYETDKKLEASRETVPGQRSDQMIQTTVNITNLSMITSYRDAAGESWAYTPALAGTADEFLYVPTVTELFKPSEPTTPASTIAFNDLGQAVSIEDELGSVTRSAVHGVGAGESRIRTVSIDPLGHESTVITDRRARTTRHMDALGRMETIHRNHLGLTDREVSPGGRIIEFGYDAYFNVDRETRIASDTPSDRIEVTRVYDTTFGRHGDVRQITDARQGVYNIFYYAHGGIRTILRPTVDGRRPETEYRYTAYSSVTPDNAFVQLLYSPHQFHLPTRMINAEGEETCYEYWNPHASGVSSSKKFDVRSVTLGCQDTALSYRTSFNQDAVGNVIEIDGPRSDVVDISVAEFDALRRPIYVRTADPDGSGPHGAPVSVNVFDEDGLLIKTCLRARDTSLPADLVGSCSNANHANQNFWIVTTFSYDEVGRPSSVTDADGYVSQTRYDAEGRAIVAIDAEGRKTRTVYDAADQVTKVIRGWRGNDGGTGATLDCAAMRTQYNAAADILQSCYREQDHTLSGQVDWVRDANGNLTDYAYDGHDRLKRTTFPDSSFEELTYDANGNVNIKRTRANDKIEYVYDALDRLEKRIVPVRDDSDSKNFTFGYDLVDRKVFDEHRGVQQRYAYDGAGRLVQKCHHKPTAFSSLDDPDCEMSVSYAYDAAGNVTRMTYPDDWSVDFAYDALNRIIAANEAPHRVDGTDVPSTLYGARGELLSVDYDVLSRRKTLSYGNGVSASFDYEDRGMLSGLGVAFGSGESAAWSFTSNGVGQLLTSAVNDNLPALPSGGSALLWTPQAAGAAFGSVEYDANALNQYDKVGPAAPAYDANG